MADALPDILPTIASAHEYAARCRSNGERIGLVPTMGALHDGHLSLISLAHNHPQVDRVVLTIFVNPLQFGANEDLDRYPRTLEQDRKAGGSHGADVVFVPSVQEMYPADFQTTVLVSELTQSLCGASRPTHFSGVTTVVSKLFNLFAPEIAVFGEKDFQQLCVIRRLVHDLGWPIQIVGGPIVREVDGLALSSRNRYLSAEYRSRAPSLYRLLKDARARVAAGDDDPTSITTWLTAQIAEAGLELDYAEVVDPDTLRCPSRIVAGSRVCVAAWLGQTRLIDNLALA